MQSTNQPDNNLEDRFVGCLLGLAVGDALGSLFEAQSAEHIRKRFLTADEMINYPIEPLTNTDDTQMAIGVAEALIDDGEIIEENLCKCFVANYIPSRGYGMGARRVLDAMEDGQDYRQIAEMHFPGGSYGNGAAMRVAPVGMHFHRDHAKLIEQARLSALPTHRHPLGIEGAQLLALAVALCLSMESFDRDEFFTALLAVAIAEEYRAKLQQAAELQDPAQLAALGNGIQAHESVVTAIAAFALTPQSYQDVVTNVIYLGGDTDTLAAMAGALAGAYLGDAAIPETLLTRLEDTVKGRSYIVEQARVLYASLFPGRPISM